MRSPLLPAAGAALLAAAACDPQATTDYLGEPMASVRGVISSDLVDVPDGLVPYLLWEAPDLPLIELDLVLDFPSRFELVLHQPAPDEVLHDLGAAAGEPSEARIAIAVLETLPLEVAEDGTYPFGVAEHHVIVYAEADVVAGTRAAALVGGELAAGYHLAEVVPTDDPACGGEYDCLRPAPDDLDTPIEIRVDWLTELAVPYLGLVGGPTGPGPAR
jgi:hypothetical protein